MSEINELKYIKSTRGADLLIHRDYCYRKRNVNGLTIYWTCIKSDCKGKLTTLSGSFISSTHHTHEPDYRFLIETKQRNLSKELAKDSTRYPRIKEIYQQATSELLRSNEYSSEQIGANLKTFDAIKKTISRARNHRYGTIPSHRRDLEIPEHLMNTSDGERFWRSSDGEEDKIVVFATNQFLKYLTEANHIYCDGTFKSVPKIFHSLYTIHVMKNNMMIPVVYILLPGASKLIYIRMIRIIQDLCSELDLVWNPKLVTTDFEISALKAFKAVFPNCTFKCCFFHLCQSLWRNLVRLNLRERYLSSETDPVRVAIKRISALPFAKVNDIVPMMDWICNNAPSDADMVAFLCYFKNTYLLDDARFPVDTWNHFNDPDPRTNNHVEGWHYALNKAIARHHANIFYYIEKLIQVQNNYEVMVLMGSFGAQPQPRNKVYVELDKRIASITQLYDEGQLTPSEFIDKVRHLTSVSE